MRVFVEHPATGQDSINLYGYSPIGELTRIEDAEHNVTELSYDLRGLQTTINSADTGLIERRYDLMGNLAELIEPNHRALGSSVKYLHERNRLVGIDYPRKTDVHFVYGEPGASKGRAGRIAEVHDETGVVETEYGALGEVRRTLRTVDSPLTGQKPQRFETQTTFDSFGRLLETVYPDGEIVRRRPVDEWQHRLELSSHLDRPRNHDAEDHLQISHTAGEHRGAQCLFLRRVARLVAPAGILGDRADVDQPHEGRAPAR